MNTQRSFTKTAKTIQLDLVSKFNYLNESINMSLNDILSLDILHVYNHDSFDKRSIAIIRQIQEIDSRMVPEDVGIEPDTECWHRFKSSQFSCCLQNLQIKQMTWKGSPSLLNILLIAAGLIDEACAQVDAALTIAEDGCFLYDDYEGSHRIPVTGFNVGPGVCANTEYTDLFSKFEKGGTFAVSHKGDDKTGRVQQILVEHLLANHNGLKKLGLRKVSQAAVENCYVPKKKDVSRDIAPQLNGDLMLQFPLAYYLEEVLKYFNIDLSKQPQINREMARKGSLYGGFNSALIDLGRRRTVPIWCTLDLKSASNIVGVKLCELLFPEWIFTHMMASRCDNIVDRHSGEHVALECMATMGNAFCFPMQTLVFAAIVKACNIVSDIPKHWFSVFGDDIIVDQSVYSLVVKTLSEMHMIPNTKKSFASGYFRESCGGDFYKGMQVRPVSPRELNTLADYYSFINQLLDWYEMHDLAIGGDVCLALSEAVISLHYRFNNRRMKKLGKGARGNVPFFMVPRYANMSDGIRCHLQTIADSMQPKAVTNLPEDDTALFKLKDFGYFDSYLQCVCLKYPYLKVEGSYREVQSDVEIFHFLKTSGRYFDDKKNGKSGRFSVAGRGTERSVQRRMVIPFSQWNCDPEGSQSYASLVRLANECLLIKSLFVLAATAS